MENSYFYDQLNSSIDNIENWNGVLSSICKMTGAKKAIIALRDSKTAELVIPRQVTIDNFSPLLFGFSESEVESYLNKYSHIDPWTAIERKHHPHIPYFLSAYLPLSNLKTLEFYEWLSCQGISDSLVAKLDESTGEWVSLNIYFDPSDVGTADRIKNFIREMLPAVSRHWKLCRQLSQYTKGAKISEHFMNAFDFPAILVDSKCQVIAQNNEAQIQFASVFSCSETRKGFAFSRKASSQLLSILTKVNNGETIVIDEFSNNNYELHLRMLHNGEDEIGRSDNVWLLTLHKHMKARMDRLQLWNNKKLTRRESEVVKAISNGLSMSVFAKKNDISINTAKSYLRDARRKLGGITAKDIYAAAFSNDNDY